MARSQRGPNSPLPPSRTTELAKSLRLSDHAHEMPSPTVLAEFNTPELVRRMGINLKLPISSAYSPTVGNLIDTPHALIHMKDDAIKHALATGLKQPTLKANITELWTVNSVRPGFFAKVEPL